MEKKGKKVDDQKEGQMTKDMLVHVGAVSNSSNMAATFIWRHAKTERSLLIVTIRSPSTLYTW